MGRARSLLPPAVVDERNGYRGYDEELAWRAEPARHEAFIQVTKAHFEVPAIMSVYDQLAQWVSSSHGKQTGSPREIYAAGVEPLFAADTHICDVAIAFAANDSG
jgi:hypothetical protein